MGVDMVDEAPLLVFTNGTSEFQTCCTISGLPPNNKISFRHSVVDLHGKAILGSCHGWFILQNIDDGTLFSLFEPTTGQSLYLPPLDAAVVKKGSEFTCTLTSPPDGLTDTNASPCVVYLFSNGLMFSCRPTQPDCTWVIQRVEIDNKSADIIRTVISFNGSLYGWAPSYFFSAEIPNNETDDLDLVTLTNLQISDPKFDLEYECVTHNYIECSGRLYCILVFAVATVDKGIVGVKVSELDLPAKKWMEVNCLDGRAFFLNEIGDSTWCWAGVADPNSTTTSRCVKQNCVYLFSPLESDQTLYEYNMIDQSLTPICPSPDMDSSHGKPVWLRVSGANLGFDFWDSEKVGIMQWWKCPKPVNYYY